MFSRPDRRDFVEDGNGESTCRSGAPFRCHDGVLCCWAVGACGVGTHLELESKFRTCPTLLATTVWERDARVSGGSAHFFISFTLERGRPYGRRQPRAVLVPETVRGRPPFAEGISHPLPLPCVYISSANPPTGLGSRCTCAAAPYYHVDHISARRHASNAPLVSVDAVPCWLCQDDKLHMPLESHLASGVVLGRVRIVDLSRGGTRTDKHVRHLLFSAWAASRGCSRGTVPGVSSRTRCWPGAFSNGS